MTHLLSDFDWDNLEIDQILEHSFTDFHAKGMDYVCLKRTPAETVKAYFFAEGMDSQEVGEVVNPHDHRYAFMTQCFSGAIRNKWFRFPPCWDGESIGDECGPMFNVFEWRTPLLGGNGFTHVDCVPLQAYRIQEYAPGESYFMLAPEFHTIEVAAPETCIVLQQFGDVVPKDKPTHTFTQAAEPPDLSGLYGKFTADQALKRIGLLREMADRL